MKKIIITLMIVGLMFAGLSAQNMTNMENYRIYKMSEFLELTPGQAEQFFPLLRQYEKELGGIAEQENALYNEIKAKQQKGKIGEGELQRIMEQVSQFEMKRSQLKQQFMQQSGKALSPNQVSRIPFFEKEFRNELKQQFIQRQNQQGRENSKKPLEPGQSGGNPGGGNPGGGNPGQGGRP